MAANAQTGTRNSWNRETILYGAVLYTLGLAITLGWFYFAYRAAPLSEQRLVKVPIYRFGPPLNQPLATSYTIDLRAFESGVGKGEIVEARTVLIEEGKTGVNLYQLKVHFQGQRVSDGQIVSASFDQQQQLTEIFYRWSSYQIKEGVVELYFTDDGWSWPTWAIVNVIVLIVGIFAWWLVVMMVEYH